MINFNGNNSLQESIFWVHENHSDRAFVLLVNIAFLIQRTVFTGLGKPGSLDNGLWIQWIIAGILSCSNLQGEMYKQLGGQEGTALCGGRLWSRILGCWSGSQYQHESFLFFSGKCTHTCFYLVGYWVHKLNWWVWFYEKIVKVLYHKLCKGCITTASLPSLAEGVVS